MIGDTLICKNLYAIKSITRFFGLFQELREKKKTQLTISFKLKISLITPPPPPPPKKKTFEGLSLVREEGHGLRGLGLGASIVSTYG